VVEPVVELDFGAAAEEEPVVLLKHRHTYPLRNQLPLELVHLV
jgi:hypothetical protein